MHHVVATGTCSSTGYSSHYGPVPFCPPGEGWWITFVVVGILLGVFGGIMSGGSSAALIVPAVFAGIGIGTLTILWDSHVTSGTKTFAAIFGGAFALFGVVPALLIGGAGLRRASSRRSSPSPLGNTSTAPADPIMGAYAQSPPPSPVFRPATAPSASAFTPSSIGIASTASTAKPSGDALDKIAKLAQLRDQGALTQDEFNHEKAKLLTEL